MFHAMCTQSAEVAEILKASGAAVDEMMLAAAAELAGLDLDGMEMEEDMQFNEADFEPSGGK